MPQLGESVTEGTITKWFKQVGEHVAEDEPLFEVSTDKVDSEVPSPQSGYVTEIRVPEGETVDVGTVLLVLGDGPGADNSTPVVEAPPAPAAPAPVTEQPLISEPPPAVQLQSPVQPGFEAPAPTGLTASAGLLGSERLLSPLVRRLINENNLDPDQITGTGIGGRVTREDVLAVIDQKAQRSAPAATLPAPVAPAPPAPAPPAPVAPAPPASVAPAPPAPAATAPPATVAPPAPPLAPGPSETVSAAPAGNTVEKLSNIRLRTGEHMVNSLATSPHAITAMDVDYEAVERARKPLREQFKAEEGFSLTYLPFISRAVVDALAEFPHMNATVGNGELIVHHFVNLSIAVDLEFEGLLAPVVTSAEGKRLRAIAREINDLATRARSRKLMPDELAGGTFTISNSGSYGTLLVAPIINQPQVAILSTDGVKRRPVVVELPDGSESIAIHSVGNLTLSWDHRAFDGAYAAAFLARVKEILETRDWQSEI